MKIFFLVFAPAGCPPAEAFLPCGMVSGIQSGMRFTQAMFLLRNAGIIGIMSTEIGLLISQADTVARIRY